MLFVFVILALFLFVGLAVDLGFAYITHAQLAKAVDAAALTGVRNYSPFSSQADDVAKATFYTNYGTSGRDRTAPTPQVVWDTDASGNTRITVSATAIINTYFLRVLPQWKTLSIRTQAQAIRARVLLMLVLDRSGSMGKPPPYGSGGGVALPGAVTAFVNHFDNAHDNIGMCSFGTTNRLDVPVGHPFQQKIITAARAMQFPPDQWTYADGGLMCAFLQLQASPLFRDPSVQKIIVFFTDGYANTSLTNVFGWPQSPVLISQDDFGVGCPPGGPCEIDFSDPTTGAVLNNPPTGFTDPATCKLNYSFPSIDGTTKAICVTNKNVWLEGQRVAEKTANLIRQANVTIYSLGLGVPPNINAQFLQDLANDPTSADYNPNQPAGQALIAPTTAEMQPVFETIASKVALRLTQ
jgi:Flp pilus assembly protein TadG